MALVLPPKLERLLGRSERYRRLVAEGLAWSTSEAQETIRDRLEVCAGLISEPAWKTLTDRDATILILATSLTAFVEHIRTPLLDPPYIHEKVEGLDERTVREDLTAFNALPEARPHTEFFTIHRGKLAHLLGLFPSWLSGPGTQDEDGVVFSIAGLVARAQDTPLREVLAYFDTHFSPNEKREVHFPFLAAVFNTESQLRSHLGEKALEMLRSKPVRVAPYTVKAFGLDLAGAALEYKDGVLYICDRKNELEEDVAAINAVLSESSVVLGEGPSIALHTVACINLNTDVVVSGGRIAIHGPSGSGKTVSIPSLFESSPDFEHIPVFFGTNRKPTGDPLPCRAYGRKRNESESNEFGVAHVTVPVDRQLGHLASPRWWKLEFSPDARKHVVLHRIETLLREEFLSRLGNVIGESKEHDALVFIHGYNTSFAHAMRRTAQLTYDLGFQGAAIAFSWPSRATKKGYLADEAAAKWSVPHLASFLDDIHRVKGAEKVHIVAHSMGNAALCEALDRIAAKTTKPWFRQVVLAAPDIDQGVFKNLAAAIQSTAARVTLYASSNDWAMKASRGLRDFPRAGESGESLFVVPGIDTVDASAVNTGLLRHSYYGSNRTVLSDMFYLLRNELAPDQRHGLTEKLLGKLKYWVFAP